MPQKNIHPKLHSMKVCTLDGIKFETQTTTNNKGKVFNSDFHTLALPQNKTGVGALTEKDASIKKFREKRYGAGSISLSDIKKN